MIIVSCYFGQTPSGIYPAPVSHRCIFFSNNPDMQVLAESNGWQFEYVRHLPQSSDTLISSLQSKYIKFLQFLDDYTDLDSSGGILYLDHKFGVTDDHVATMLSGSSQDIIIRNTPKLKPSIQHEIDAAMRQNRYRYAMPSTIEWVECHIASGDYRHETRIVNTGMILYRHPNKARALTDQVYKTCWQLAQPECQIIWAVLSQKFAGIIGRLDWEMVNPVWQEKRPDHSVDHVKSVAAKRHVA